VAEWELMSFNAANCNATSSVPNDRKRERVNSTKARSGAWWNIKEKDCRPVELRKS
jgi:hypothetical protein